MSLIADNYLLILNGSRQHSQHSFGGFYCQKLGKSLQVFHEFLMLTRTWIVNMEPKTQINKAPLVLPHIN